MEPLVRNITTRVCTHAERFPTDSSCASFVFAIKERVNNRVIKADPTTFAALGLSTDLAARIKQERRKPPVWRPGTNNERCWLQALHFCSSLTTVNVPQSPVFFNLSSPLTKQGQCFDRPRLVVDKQRTGVRGYNQTHTLARESNPASRGGTCSLRTNRAPNLVLDHARTHADAGRLLPGGARTTHPERFTELRVPKLRASRFLWERNGN